MKGGSNSGMIDWLEIVKKAGGVAAWVTQSRNFPRRNGKQAKLKDLNQIIEMVLKMKSVQDIIRDECVRRCTTSELICDEARLILRNMAHQMQLPVIRSVGYLLAKTIKTVYDGVYFNGEQLLRIRQHSMEDPVIFMPTHRSYMDFLIVSVLCFNHNVPMPAIASGMDFMASKFLGETLRRCGSFFMRRQFGKDELYWALFKNYMQKLLLEGDNPIEFFLEGTRSRSGKSLYPKIGLLQMCIEPFMRSQLYDLIVVPITINYDKVLEELLYAYEVFGFPKPKETTAGLFRAREILRKRFGHIYVNFGQPISIREYFDGRVHRWHAQWQLNTDNRLSGIEKEAVKDFALHIIRVHNSNSTITVWPYTCAIVLQMVREGCRELKFGKLRNSLEDFVTLSTKMGRQVMVKENIDGDLRYHLKLHSELFESCHDDMFDDSLIELRRFQCTENVGSRKDYMEEVFCEVILSHYVNQMMHDFVDISLLCLLLLSDKVLSRVRRTFRELRLLFVYEFICSPKEKEIDNLFAESLNCLLRIAAVSVNNDFVSSEAEQILKQIALLMQPFIASYCCVMQALIQLTGVQFTNKTLFAESLQLAIDLRTGQQRGCSSSQTICITSDVVRNVLSALCSLHVACRCGDTQFDVNLHHLQKFRQLLEGISMKKLPFDDFLFVSKI